MSDTEPAPPPVSPVIHPFGPLRVFPRVRCSSDSAEVIENRDAPPAGDFAASHSSQMSLEDKLGLQCMTDADKLVLALIDRLVLESDLDHQTVTAIVFNASAAHYCIDGGSLRDGMTMLFDAFEME